MDGMGMMYPPPKTNRSQPGKEFQPTTHCVSGQVAPEKWWLEDYFPFGKAYFEGLC